MIFKKAHSIEWAFLLILRMIFKNLKRTNDLNGWFEIQNPLQVKTIEQKSFIQPQLIFKHSTRCSISVVAFQRIQHIKESIIHKAELIYVDVLKNRDVSHEIESTWQVVHESPQLIIIKNGNVVYHASHNGILPEEVIKAL